MAKPEVSSAKENRKSKPEVSFAFKLSLNEFRNSVFYNQPIS